MEQSEQINELGAALAKAQGEMEPLIRDADNPFFHSRYATLAAVKAVSQAALSANRLSVSQWRGRCVPIGPCWFLEIVTEIKHASGQWQRYIGHAAITETPVKGDDKQIIRWVITPQAINAAETYGRRGALCGALNLAPDDDDGEAAMGRNGNGEPPASGAEEAKGAEEKTTKAKASRRNGWLWSSASKVWPTNEDRFRALGKAIANATSGRPEAEVVKKCSSLAVDALSPEEWDIMAETLIAMAAEAGKAIEAKPGAPRVATDDAPF
jgi:hypothetical protein